MRRFNKRDEDELDWNGLGFNGAHLSNRIFCHNLDFSGYQFLIEKTWDMYNDDNASFALNCPRAVFQHACWSFLDAYLHDLIHLRGPGYGNESAIWMLNAFQYNIPVVLKDYIERIGTHSLRSGIKVYVNAPVLELPQPMINVPEDQANQSALTFVPAGSFGKPTAQNHNIYEVRSAPIVRKEYIKALVKANDYNEKMGNWTPFPPQWSPNDAVLNRNCLGWRETEVLPWDSIGVLRDCRFCEEDTLTGRYCFSSEAMISFSNTITQNENFKVLPATFKPKKNPAAFITTKVESVFDPRTPFFEHQTILSSPEFFDSKAAGIAALYCYKKIRSKRAAGLMYTFPRENAEWIANRNNNFKMIGEFLPTRGMVDISSITRREFKSTSGIPEGFTIPTLDFIRRNSSI